MGNVFSPAKSAETDNPLRITGRTGAESMHSSEYTDSTFRHKGYTAFALSGICSISCSIVVVYLQQLYGISLQTSGNLLSVLNFGFVMAGFLTGLLPSLIGWKKTVLILSAGYPIGYLLTALVGIPGILFMAFVMIGLARGCATNTCTVLVGSHTRERTKSLQLMNACYALGALSGPFVLSAAGHFSLRAAILLLALSGLAEWTILAGIPFEKSSAESGQKSQADKSTKKADRSFLRSADFWLLTVLLFFQSAEEISVSGWLVTYYKNQKILSGTLATYTVTIMWGTMLVGRLLLAFVIPVRNRYRAITIMGILSAVTYALLMQATGSVSAILALFAFALAECGIYPTATSCAGSAMTPEGMGIMLPVASIGSVLMPSIIGTIAERVDLRAGMAANLIPCIGIAILSIVLSLRSRRQARA